MKGESICCLNARSPFPMADKAGQPIVHHDLAVERRPRLCHGAPWQDEHHGRRLFLIAAILAGAGWGIAVGKPMKGIADRHRGRRRGAIMVWLLDRRGASRQPILRPAQITRPMQLSRRCRSPASPDKPDCPIGR